ncbi:MAG: substrate-binding domain-containing protein [Candidatus Hydrogenedens sp.]|nr:substrate-binding domain-containing protein [Candidatus Hydrogenedens sp.]
MRKRLLLAASAVLVSVVFTACGSGSPAPGDAAKPVIGAALLTQTHIFYQDMVAAMQQEAEAQGFQLRLQYAEFDSRRQHDQIETFIAQGVDALIVAPNDSSGMVPVIAEARAAGIPVFTADIAAHDADAVSHIASDNVQGGRILAEYLAKELGGKGKIAIVDHPIVASVQDRTRGFVEVIDQYPDLTIVQRVPSEGQRDKALRVTQDLLQAHPDLDAIFGINDDSALGALAAVEAAGLQDKIIIVGFDGTPEARDAIRQGKALKADTVQFPDKIGATTIQVIAKQLKGEEVPPIVPVEVALITQESLAAEQQ